MKILHLIGGGDIGGAKRHVLSLVRELGKHITVKLVSYRTGSFSNDAKKMGIDIEIVDYINPINEIKRMSKIMSNGYDLIHSHGAKANMMAVILKYKYHIPTITTIHSDYKLDYLQSIYKNITFKNINTFALKFIDNYIAVSKNFSEMLSNRGFNPKNIYTVYNGIDFTETLEKYSKKDFFKSHNIEYNSSDLFIGILARFHPVKDITTFIKAAYEIIKQKPNIKFLIAGDGDEKKLLKKKVSEYNLENNVHFLGFINNAYEFFNAIDINVLTSLSETFPYSILEGVLLKKATISSNVGGISDLIEHNINGYLFEPKDYITLSKQILSLVNNEKTRKEFGENIFKKASVKFSLKKLINTHLEIYSNVLEKKSSQKPQKKSYDFVISGYYGSGNIGDEAILNSIINDLKNLKPDAKIMVLSKNPNETSRLYGVDSTNRLILIQVLKSMYSSKLFINGGGSLIQDIKSSRSLFYYLSTIFFAKYMGLKVMLYANGIGPINKKFNRFLTKQIINKADIITLRDISSKEELDAMEVKKPHIQLTADPAINTKPSSEKQIEKIFIRENIPLNRKYVILSLRKWNNYEAYLNTIIDISNYIISSYNIIPIFVPMHFPEDLKLAQIIESMLHNECYIIKNKYIASEITGIIKKSEFVISMRLHPLIFAASIGIPIIGIEYEKKIRGFLKSLDLYDKTYAGHIDKLDYKTLKEKVDYVYKEKEFIKSLIKEKTKDCKNYAIQNAQIAIDQLEIMRCNNGRKASYNGS